MGFTVKNNQVYLDKVPGKIKKITGTRFASILGLDPWKSPFKTWCDMTKVYSDPFEESVHTIAGKTIEPKVIKYLDARYHFGKNVVKDPDTWFGKDIKAMKYDHFHDEPILGGMWDARTKDMVYELKTSGRVQDWMVDGVFDAPTNYKLQGALYCYLLGLDRFRMVLSITDDTILADPDAFVPTPQNTLFREYSLSKDLPDFPAQVEAVLQWYKEHIETGISPAWNPKDARDMEVVKQITTNTITFEPGKTEEADPIQILLGEIEPLQAKLDEYSAVIAPDEEKLKSLKDQLKTLLMDSLTDKDLKATVTGSTYKFELGKSQKKGIDSKALEKDGLLSKYQTITETYTLRTNAIKKEDPKA
jgi:hypothetical protein